MKAMRVSALILFVVLGAVSVAHAEKVKTNQSTKLYAGPGEQKKVLLKVKSGQNMTLLAQDGRWLKVRVSGRTGYVPRSKVDMADDGEIARNTRRRPFVDGRSRRRGFGGEAGPDDRVGADAIGEGREDEDSGEAEEEEEEEPKKPRKASKSNDDEEEDEPKKPAKKPAKPAKDEDEDEDEEEPKKASKGGDDEDMEEDDEEIVDDEKTPEPEEDARPTARVAKKVSVFEEADSESEELFIARPTDMLYPVEEKGKWTAVENEEGDYGWVETEYLELEDGGGGSGGMKKRQIDLGARLGLMIIQQGMRAAGDNLKVPDNYNIGTSSVTVSLGGSYMMPFKKKYILGGEATYDYSKTVLGGVFYDPPDEGGVMTPGVNTGLTIHNINFRGMAGYDLKKKSGAAVIGRLGYRYQSYLVDNYADAAKNPARIPQEIMKGPALGAAFVMPRLTNKIGIRASLDAVLFGGTLTQTKGLEDGSAPTFKAVTLGAGFTYKWKKKMDLIATYDLRYTGISFGSPPASSMRGHMGTSVTRTDFFHALGAGIAMPF